MQLCTSRDCVGGGGVWTTAVAKRRRAQYSFWKPLRLPRLQDAKTHRSSRTVDQLVLVSWQHRKIGMAELVVSEEQAISRLKGSRGQDRSRES